MSKDKKKEEATQTRNKSKGKFYFLEPIILRGRFQVFRSQRSLSLFHGNSVSSFRGKIRLVDAFTRLYSGKYYYYKLDMQVGSYRMKSKTVYVVKCLITGEVTLHRTLVDMSERYGRTVRAYQLRIDSLEEDMLFLMDYRLYFVCDLV